MLVFGDALPKGPGPHQGFPWRFLLVVALADGLHDPGFAGGVHALLEVLDGRQLPGNAPDARGVVRGPLPFGAAAAAFTRVLDSLVLCAGRVPSRRV
ncbi:hypothetical protein GCM10010307_26370 [Streptomyces vastus]|uniref:Uncharacterized protein n=1 Tax=Streptomyces vastus TaxID=285451 RepID=A0ABN3QQK4_9ACTN